MKALVVCLSLLASLSASAGTKIQNFQYPRDNPRLNLLGCVGCFDFVAPAVFGAENIPAPEVGLIVYDSSLGMFRGLDQQGVWNSLSNDQVLSSVSSAGSVESAADLTLADTTGASFTLTLPSAASVSGRSYTIKKTSASNVLTIDGYSTQTIDGQLSLDLVSNNAIVELVSDGTNFVIKAARDPWRVDANIGGANPSLGTSAVSTYSGIENGSLSLTNTGTVTAQIPCSSTNSPSGTTCSTGNESVGVSFSLPRAGDVLACASFSVGNGQSAGNLAETVFQVVETPSNAQTISTEGKSRLSSGTSTAGQATNGIFPLRVCGTFNFSSSGQKTLRLMYEMAVSGTPSAPSLLSDGGASAGQRDIHWEVYPLN